MRSRFSLILTGILALPPLALAQGMQAGGMDTGTTAADRRISEAVRAAIAHERGADMIRITTDNGVVSLVGAVPSDTERAELVRAAKATSGVKSVDDQITTSAGSSTNPQTRGLPPSSPTTPTTP